MSIATHGQGGWVGVGYSYPDVSKSTPLLILPQTPPNRYNFEVSKATLPLNLEFLWIFAYFWQCFAFGTAIIKGNKCMHFPVHRSYWEGGIVLAGKKMTPLLLFGS